MQDDRRTRALQALAAELADMPPGSTDVPLVSARRRAALTRADFEELFDGPEQALLAAFEEALAAVAPQVDRAYERGPRWIDGVRGAMAAMLRFLEAEPAFGRLLVLSHAGGGELLLARRMEVFQQLAAAVDSGRRQRRGARAFEPSPLVAEGVIGSVLAILERHLLGAEATAPIELNGELVAIVALPYLGAAAAAREQQRPAPPEPGPLGGADGSRVAAGALRRRLTYRTMRVLGALAESPGASNRELADRAGIIDQGQISKLLSRLHASGLIEKLGERQGRGTPNSWLLTEAGRRVVAG